MFKLVAATQIKNEAPYLAEWIEFHLLQGFEHFYFYDNGSTDNFRDVLTQYADIVSIIQVPPELWNKASGFWSINKMLANRAAKWLWVASIDEYMFCPQGPRVSDFLDDYDEFAALAIQWELYNSSWKAIKEDDLVIERFYTTYDENPLHIKSIIQPAKVVGYYDPHSFKPKPPFKCVNENKEPLVGPHPTYYTANKIRINHYWTMSRQEFLTKMDKGRSDIPGLEDTRRANCDVQWEAAHREKRYDFSAFRFIGPVKEALIRRNGH